MSQKGRTLQPCTCLAIQLVICIHVSTQQTTWLDALHTCRRKESVIAQTNQSGFWSPGVTFNTPWLSLIDCRQSPANRPAIDVNTPETCLVHCLSQNYTVFGLQKQSTYRCWCLNDTTTQYNAQCSFCSLQSKLLCGGLKGMAVYRVRTDLQLLAPAHNQCLSLQCEGVLLTPRSCDDYGRGLCAQNSNEACVPFEPAMWRNYSFVSSCPQLYYHQTETVCSIVPLYICGPPRLPFPRTSPFWIHTIRETVTCHVNSDSTCVDYLLNVKDIQHMQCPHVTEDGTNTLSSCNDIRMFECNDSNTTTESNKMKTTPKLWSSLTTTTATTKTTTTTATTKTTTTTTTATTKTTTSTTTEIVSILTTESRTEKTLSEDLSSTSTTTKCAPVQLGVLIAVFSGIIVGMSVLIVYLCLKKRFLERQIKSLTLSQSNVLDVIETTQQEGPTEHHYTDILPRDPCVYETLNTNIDQNIG